MKIFETNRLVFRHLQAEDLDDFFALYCDPDFKKYIPDAPETYAQTRKELEWFQNGHPKDPRLGLWVIIHKETGGVGDAPGEQLMNNPFYSCSVRDPFDTDIMIFSPGAL